MREGIPWDKVEVVTDGQGHFSNCRDTADGRGISTVIPVGGIQKSLNAKKSIDQEVDDRKLKDRLLPEELFKKFKKKKKLSRERVLKKCRRDVVFKEEVTIFFYYFCSNIKPKIGKKDNFVLPKPVSSYKLRSKSATVYENCNRVCRDFSSQQELNLTISHGDDKFFQPSLESSTIQEEAIEYPYIPYFKYRNRKRKLRSWQRIQSVPAGAPRVKMVHRGRQMRGKKGTGRHLKRITKTERVYPKAPVRIGPRYNITKQELKKAYQRMRKGNRFCASWNVLWKNRFNIVLGCSNYYRKGDQDITYIEEFLDKMCVKERDMGEPPEVVQWAISRIDRNRRAHAENGNNSFETMWCYDWAMSKKKQNQAAHARNGNSTTTTGGASGSSERYHSEETFIKISNDEVEKLGLKLFKDNLYGGGKRKTVDSDSDYSPDKKKSVKVN